MSNPLEIQGVSGLSRMGFTDDRQAVILTQTPHRIQLTLRDTSFGASMTPADARHLASKLYRLARRIEAAGRVVTDD